MKDSIISKDFENKSIKEKLDLNWKGIRELYNKQNTKKLMSSFDDEILSYLAIEPGLNLLKELGLFEQFEEHVASISRFSDLESTLKEFLVFGLSETFEVNKKIQKIKGKIGPYEIAVPKNSKELFDLGLSMSNCLTQMHVIQDYRNEYWMVSLTYEGIPVIGVKFEDCGGLLKCSEALYVGNRDLAPHEFYVISELEEKVADVLKMRMFREATEDDVECVETILREFERVLR